MMRERFLKVKIEYNNMFEWIFGSKKDVKRVEEDTKKGFNSVKEDINKLGVWIKHLDKSDEDLKNQNYLLREELSTIKDELESIKNIISFHDLEVLKQLGKSQTARLNKQTGGGGVQGGVQTAVQTADFNKNTFFDISKLSVMERAIIMVLLNTDMKLSYDDLSAMLGKDRSTIRGHINRIKQKNESLVEEIIEQNGKKRVFIPQDIKENMLKNVKVRVGNSEKGFKKLKN